MLKSVETNAIFFMQPQRLKGSQVTSIDQLIIAFHIARLYREIGDPIHLFAIVTEATNGIHAL